MSTVPIDISYRSNQGTTTGGGRIPTQFHRESFAHSQGMGGISWGAASIGSWLRDEVMTNTLLEKPSLGQNESALSMSPDFLTVAPTAPSLEQDFCRDYTCCGRNLPTLHDLLQHYEEAHISPSPPEDPPVMRRMQNMEMVSTNEVFLPPGGANIPGGIPSVPGVPGVSGVSGVSGVPGVDSHQLNSHNLGGSRNIPGDQIYAANNGINLVGQGQYDYSHARGDPHAIQGHGIGTGNIGGSGTKIDGSVGHLQDKPLLQRRPLANTNPGEEDELCIDDPARQLYVMERNENKPYRCPVIGCDKMYKNQNGLKYHRQHGHQNQKLHQNEDGSFSIIDPLSNTPYPDGMGMEKDKPYRCEICGKRYKNLNGLKYHRAHSTH